MCTITYGEVANDHRINTVALQSAFKKNLKDLHALKWQYFASQDNILYFYPALVFSQCEVRELYDYRLR